MLKKNIVAAAVAAAFALPSAFAADDAELAQIREQIRQLKETYEVRIQALEKRVQEAEAKSASAPAEPARAVAAAPAASGRSNANAFNPSIALTLGGTYARLSQDPAQYRLQGFIPGGEESGPGKRGLNLGESELTLSASVDPMFAGQLTFALAPDNSASVEEAFFRTQALPNGMSLRGGRFLSEVGYLNSQHAHAWDFVDAPLAYQAMFGGQYRTDGVQFKWLAPTERFFQAGLELGSGSSFPGTERNRNSHGALALFAHVGDDIGASASWRAGLSYLKTRSAERAYDDFDAGGAAVTNAFSGDSNIWLLDGVYKWAPDGNATHRHFKLQGEYFRRKESGTLSFNTHTPDLASAANYASAQSGWYLQGVYQFRPNWRAGLRYDKLNSGTPTIDPAAGATGLLAPYNPSRTSAMVDFSPSEFSRLRLQVARDRSRPDATDNQIFLQYIMSLGAHAAHAF